MTHKKKSSYKEVGKQLKKFGLIGYDLRRELNSGQKAQITKLAAEYKQLINKPEAFIAPKVKPAQAEKVKTAGYKVTRQGRAIIPLHEYKSAKLKGDQIFYDGGPGGKSEKVMLAGSKEFFRLLKRQADAAKKLPRNQMVSVSINGAHYFFNARFRTYADLYQYVNNWQPKDPGANRGELIARMSIVTIQPPKKQIDRKDSSRSRRKGK